MRAYFDLQGLNAQSSTRVKNAQNNKLNREGKEEGSGEGRRQREREREEGSA